jgi:hypothetical protein
MADESFPLPEILKKKVQVPTVNDDQEVACDASGSWVQVSERHYFCNYIAELLLNSFRAKSSASDDGGVPVTFIATRNPSRGSNDVYIFISSTSLINFISTSPFTSPGRV